LRRLRGRRGAALEDVAGVADVSCDLNAKVISFEVENAGILICPSTPPDRRGTSYNKNSYGYNYTQLGHWTEPGNIKTGDDGKPPTKLSSIRRPSNALIVVDSNADRVADALSIRADTWVKAAPGRLHSGSANVLFADWHVERPETYDEFRLAGKGSIFEFTTSR
jgi:prepilin-type processing-associated H-X9-DG protein